MPDIRLEPLKGYKAFDTVFKAGVRFQSKNTLAVVIFKEENANSGNTNTDDSVIVFYGAGISKKNAKKAVVRNRVKRLIRESLRLLAKQDELKKVFENIGSVIIIRKTAPDKPAKISLNDVMPEIRQLLLKLPDNYQIESK